MTETRQTSNAKTDRRPDCVTETRIGNTVLGVSAFSRRGNRHRSRQDDESAGSGSRRRIFDQKLIEKPI